MEQDKLYRSANIEYLGQQLKYVEKHKLLEFFKTNNLPAKSSCRVGACGAGRVKCKADHVKQLIEIGLTRLDKKQSYLLARPVDGSK